MNSIFIACFGSITDPRIERTKKHLLLDIIALAICGLISGAQTWEEIEDFGCLHKNWFSQFLELPNGIPSHDTIGRVFAALNPKELQESSVLWLKHIRNLLPETVIPIDGKTLRRSGEKSSCKKALHVMNAWSCANGMSLGQLKVEGKSNEITAVPEMLKQLALKGAIVTLDAMGCQEKTLKQIVDAEADYIVALKGNQGQLHEQIRESFELFDQGAKTLKVHETSDEIDADHGRIEQRQIQVIDTQQLKDYLDPRWQRLQSIIRVIYTNHKTDETRSEQRFYISSLEASDPLKILKAIRDHWQVENCLHWSLDVTFREDDCRIRNENAALNMSWLRKLALGLLKKETSFRRASIRRKQRKAFVDVNYLQRIIAKI